MRALIGHTGFVGSNLKAAGHYDAFFNTSNSSDMRGQSFTEVVCAGVSAVKWKANKDPNSDWAGIENLIDNLRQINTQRFVLISTIDVYKDPISVTEADEPIEEGGAYGVHRKRLECFVAKTFSNHLIIRLPALYGPGLKKNAIYDLQHDNMVEAIDPRGSFQWYDVSRLESDMRRISEAGLSLINVAAEPVMMSEIADLYFPGKLRPADETKPAASYDMRTKYATVLGGEGSYHFSHKRVIDGIGNYLKRNL